MFTGRPPHRSAPPARRPMRSGVHVRCRQKPDQRGEARWKDSCLVRLRLGPVCFLGQAHPIGRFQFRCPFARLLRRGPDVMDKIPEMFRARGYERHEPQERLNDCESSDHNYLGLVDTMVRQASDCCASASMEIMAEKSAFELEAPLAALYASLALSRANCAAI